MKQTNVGSHGWANQKLNHGVGSSDHFLYIFWLLENMLLSLHSLIKNNKYQNDQENRPCDFLVQSLEKTRRNVVLRAALSYGAGIRQLSRLTGISFGVIQKLTK